MDDNNYPNNSHKDKEVEKKSRPKVEKVVTGEAKERKEGLGRRVAKSFTGDDAQSVGSYILFDVMIPAAKNMISDMVSQGIERALFGSSRSRPLSTSRPGYTSYNKVSSARTSEPSKGISQRARATHDFKEIVLETREEAERVIQGLIDVIEDYGFTTVSDLYDLVGITGSFTDDKWGWNDLRGATHRRVREGYLLELPRTIPAD